MSKLPNRRVTVWTTTGERSNRRGAARCNRAKCTYASVVHADVEKLIREKIRVVITPGTYLVSAGGHQNMATTTEHAFTFDQCSIDDRAAELNAGSYHKISPPIRQIVGRELERFILSHIDARRDLAFETTWRCAITFEQTILAHANGFRITMVYVAAGPVEEHIRRVANRADLGQHSASEAKIRDIY